MRRTTLLALILLTTAIAASAAGASKSKLPAAKTAEASLPRSFAGWQMNGPVKTVMQPAEIDPANPALLSEYGFQKGELADYTRDGNTVQVKLVQFANASGAFGTFTFFRTEVMLPQSVGDAAVSSSGHVLFARANVLVEANFAHPSGMSIAELRDLAAKLPQVQGESRTLPTITNYLPQQQLNKASVRYIAGPVALRSSNLPENLADFRSNAEVALGEYKTSAGLAELAVISYPTPQVAAAKLHDLQLKGDFVASRRSGPLLAVVTGKISKSEAESLTESVNYDASVTWNERTSFTGRDNIGNLIVGIFMLVGVLLLIALGGGFLVGGSRMLLRKTGKIRPDEDEVIRLNLH